MTKSSRIAVVALVGLSLTACNETGIAYGDVNSIIAVMTPDLWEQTEESVYAALEPTIQTVGDEKTFTVTYQDPAGEHWTDLRRFRQMLLFGTADKIWMQEAMAESAEPITEPGFYQVGDVWARGQQITIVLLPDGAGAADVQQHLGAINTLLDGQFRTYARNRMYMSGVDSALADTLYTELGFTLMLPQVYDWRASDSVYIFRNDNPSPDELIREISVSWRTPIPADMQAESILAWREEVVSEHYSEPQDHSLDDSDASAIDYPGLYAYQIRAQWQNPPDRGWPAGGPFITRAIVCEGQNRMYLVDGWLYAPGKEKYEYMIQLETILDSFRCGAA
jgi:hypothetical protein